MAQPDFSDGAMLALYPPAALARKLAIPGGLDPADLHVTISYVGAAADVDRKQLRKAAKALADRPPVAATISGHARFTATGGEDAIVALVDSPQLDDLNRDAIGELKSRGITPARNHGYTAHISLGYVGKDDPDPVGRLAPIPVTFAGVTATHGGSRKHRPFDTTLTEAAREAFATGWALSGGPLTSATAGHCEAAVRVALEHCDDPHVLEATLTIGQLKGLWALIFARREQVIAAGIAAISAAWRSAASGLGIAGVVDTLLAAIGPPGADGRDPARDQAAATAASTLMAGMYAAAEHGDLLAAVEGALLAGMAEGTAGMAGLNAEQAGYAVIAGIEKGDTAAQVFSLDTAYGAYLDELANLPALPMMAQQWAEQMIRGAADDVGKMLAKLLADPATTRKDIVRALTEALDVDAGDSVAARAVTLFADQAISQAMSRAALQLYASEGTTEAWFTTAGDSRVCPACEEAQDNSPYAPADCPVPGLHPLCRCVVNPSDPAPFQALLKGLI